MGNVLFIVSVIFKEFLVGIIFVKVSAIVLWFLRRFSILVVEDHLCGVFPCAIRYGCGFFFEVNFMP